MDPPQETEAELERFRRQWQEEVSKRNKQSTASATSRPDRPDRPDRRKFPTSGPSVSAHKAPVRRTGGTHDEEEIDPQAYHDLPDKEAELCLDAADHGLVRGSSKKAEPESALEHYERAVEKEGQGSLGDSLKHYRRAFKLDDRVHEQYKNKHFPPSASPPKRPAVPPTHQKPANTNPSNASVTVPNPAHHSLQEGAPSPAHALAQPRASAASIPQLVEAFSQLTIPGAPAPTDADPPPPCPIADLPGELLSDIMTQSAVIDLASLSRLSQVCKRFAYLVMTDEQIWRRIAQGPEYGFAAMHYDYVCDLKGQPLDDYSDLTFEGADIEHSQPRTLNKTTPDIDFHLLTSQYRSSWRQMFRQRPRLRFNGCYISTVNYTRPGAASTDSRTWGTPIHIITYFRYLRFFRDGSVISLLTTTEPVDVVHHLTKENLPAPKGRDNLRAGGGPQHGGALPSAVMKDALRGRWHLSGPGDGSELSDASDPSIVSSHASVAAEPEGDVHIETEGVIPKYMWKMQFALASAGRKDGARNNKLTWKGFWSYNKLTDDWGEFGLKNDKAFYFSRVRGYGRGY